MVACHAHTYYALAVPLCVIAALLALTLPTGRPVPAGETARNVVRR